VTNLKLIVQGLSELQPDCLFEVALKLPTRADILRLAATSRRLWTIIGSSDFKDAYYTTNGTSVAELIGVLNTRENQIMAISVGISTDFTKWLGQPFRNSCRGLPQWVTASQR